MIQLSRAALVTLVLVLGGAATSEAQPPAVVGPGAGGPRRPRRRHQVSRDRRRRTRHVSAARAQRQGSSWSPSPAQRLPMEKNDQGVWSATSATLAPDYYTYSFVIDGVTINDPANRQAQTSFGSSQSMFVVPGPQPWLPRPACRAARSRGTRSIRRSPTTIATSSSTRRPATTRAARSRIPCSSCCTDWATTRNAG